MKYEIREVTAPGREEVELFRDYSSVFFDSVESCSLDWCFVDASHFCHDVWLDLMGAFDAVRSGGFICGDDLGKKIDGSYQVLEGLNRFLSGWDEAMIFGYEDKIEELILYNDQYVMRKS